MNLLPSIAALDVIVTLRKNVTATKIESNHRIH